MKTLYPFARTLYQILSVTNANRDDAVHGEKVTWRGTRLSKLQIEDYKKIAKKQDSVGLMGFTTVSTSREFALQYALYSDQSG